MEATKKPRMLELFAGAQGSAVGFARAGWSVVATDIEKHEKHPEVEEFFTADSLDVLRDHAYLRTFDLVAGGPPCQRFTKCQRIQKNDHPNLIPDMRNHCQEAGVQYVIENVPEAPLIDPVLLCGCMFPGLMVYRERIFESSIPLRRIPHDPEATHLEPLVKMGRPPVPGHRMHVVGNFSGVKEARVAMGIDWNMKRDDLRESIPPAYTKWIGEQLLPRFSN